MNNISLRVVANVDPNPNYYVRIEHEHVKVGPAGHKP